MWHSRKRVSAICAKESTDSLKRLHIARRLVRKLFILLCHDFCLASLQRQMCWPRRGRKQIRQFSDTTHLLTTTIPFFSFSWTHPAAPSTSPPSKQRSLLCVVDVRRNLWRRRGVLVNSAGPVA